MTGKNGVHSILYGGDYNPEQWPEEVWEEDMRLFHEAGINEVTLNVFSWASLQPGEEKYDFSRLDKVMELLRDNGLSVIMATSTAAHPAWMAKRHPDVLRTEANGMRRKFGGRHNSCPNSPTYRKYSALLALKLAERYREWDNIVGWHVSNEYGGECYCENCEKRFREWLREKYGTLEELNRAWNTAFWGHTFYDWGEIVVPNLLSEHFDGERTNFQGISLDYRRFNSDSLLECFLGESRAIRQAIPDARITTNLMGFYKPLDYQKWAKQMDFISWDNYPSNQEPYSLIAMRHDLMRGLKGGKPFVLMEQTPSVTNWQPYNALKRPGVMRLWSYQAMAHGADAILFFQLRRSIGACEKYHGAVIDHVGHGDTRVFREVAQLGRELGLLGERTLGARARSKVAVLADWDNWWAVEYSAGPSCDLRYMDEVYGCYRALAEQNYSVDIIGAEDDFSAYRMVAAPLLYMVKSGLDEKLRSFVKGGGTFVTTFFSGIVEEHDLVVTGGYPGRLRDVLGIWVEESDALPPDSHNSFIYGGEKRSASLLCDLIHLEGAEGLSCYEEDFYAGMPVLTRNHFGEGEAFYVGTRADGKFYRDFFAQRCEELGIKPVIPLSAVMDGERDEPAPEGLEAVERFRDERGILFLLNHSEKAKRVVIAGERRDLLTGESLPAGRQVRIEGRGVRILDGKLL